MLKFSDKDFVAVMTVFPQTTTDVFETRKYPEQYKEELNGKFITENYRRRCEELRGWAQL